jgi:hypothetical protein
MYSSSRTWVNPRVKENAERQKMNFARRKICPRSPFWHSDFDYAAHKKEWEAGRSRRVEQRMARELEIAEDRQKLQNVRFPIPPHIRTAFDGKNLNGHYSPVTSRETIFCPQWEKGKENVSPWPSKSEMKYEGDDRISTDPLHARFLGAPRVEGNETVNWQHRAIIAQYPLDDFYYPIPDEETIMHRTWNIGYFQFTAEEGEEALGKEMMDLVDPKDQWV